MRLGIGNNYFENAADQPATIMIDGARVLKLETREHPGVASMNLWDSAGERLAVLQRGAWSYRRDGLDVTTDPEHLTVRDGDRLVLEVLRPEADYIWIHEADFFSLSGVRVLISPDRQRDLEFWDGDQRLASLRACKFLNPKIGIDIVQHGPTQLTDEGVALSRESPGLTMERQNFGRTPS